MLTIKAYKILTLCNCDMKIAGQNNTMMAPITTPNEPQPMQIPLLTIGDTISEPFIYFLPIPDDTNNFKSIDWESNVKKNIFNFMLCLKACILKQKL